MAPVGQSSMQAVQVPQRSATGVPGSKSRLVRISPSRNHEGPAFLDEVGALPEPAEPGARGQLALEDGPGVHVRAARHLRRLPFQERLERFEARQERDVIVRPQGVPRHVRDETFLRPAIAAIREVRLRHDDGAAGPREAAGQIDAVLRRALHPPGHAGAAAARQPVVKRRGVIRRADGRETEGAEADLGGTLPQAGGQRRERHGGARLR